MNRNHENNWEHEKETNQKVILEFKDVVAISLAMFRIVLPKVAILVIAMWLAGIFFTNVLGA